MIECPICKKQFKQLHGSHIKTHNISTKDFKLKYPHVSLRNEASYKIAREKSNILDLQTNKKCKNCSSLITGSYRKIKNFCNSSCCATYNNKLRFHKMKLQFDSNICRFCNKEYKVLKYRSKISKFCSTKCSSRSRLSKKILVKCDQCGNTTEKTPHSFKNSDNHFCCNKCKNTFFSGTSKYRGVYSGYNGKSSISSYRKKAFDAYEHKCAHCNFKKFITILQVHHIDKNRNNNNIDNLIILCPTCHACVHQDLITISPASLKVKQITCNDRTSGQY